MERKLPGANISKLKEAGVIDLTRHACWSSDTLWQGCCDCKRDPCGKCRSWAHCAFCKEYEQHHLGGLTIYHHFICDRMVAPFIVLMQDFPIKEIEAAAKRPVIARWFFTRTHISVSWFVLRWKNLLLLFCILLKFDLLPLGETKGGSHILQQRQCQRRRWPRWNDERGKGQAGAQCHIYLPRNSSIGARFYADTRGRGRGNMGSFHYFGGSFVT